VIKAKLHFTVVFLTLAALFSSCGGKPARSASASVAPSSGIKSGSRHTVYVVMDTVDDWSSQIRDGFIDRLDALLSEKSASAEYRFFDTRLDAATAAGIKAAIESGKPGLCCVINYPSAFADINITQKLRGAEYRFISENSIPIQSKTISSMEKPGGNVSGVGVFLQLNPNLRLIKKTMPEVKRIFSYSWDQMTLLNAWWKDEIERACREEGFILEEFRLIKSIQEEMAILEKFSDGKRDTAILSCVSAYVNDDGSPANANSLLVPYFQGRSRMRFMAYEDGVISMGGLMGACVIWKDIGAQLADKAIRALAGENPGDLPWEYPRMYNIVINKKTADKIGLVLSQDILNASYRIYTDYSGTFMGKGD
jgi:putative ABC transport system substrate-binding protein